MARQVNNSQIKKLMDLGIILSEAIYNFKISKIIDKNSELDLNKHNKSLYNEVNFEKYEDNKARVIFQALMINEKIEDYQMCFTFQGSGDSGECSASSIIINGKHYDNFLYFEIERSIDEIADQFDFDWYNNEGGSGTVDINYLTGDVIIEGDLYFMDSISINENLKFP